MSEQNSTVTQAKAKAMFEAAWELLSRRLGSEGAKTFALQTMKQRIGRENRDDELDGLIRLYLSASQHALASTNSRTKISPALIRDKLLAEPPQVRSYRAKNGPNAAMLRDPDTGDEFFDPDLELEAVPYVIKLKPASLLKRIERIMDKMIEAGQLDRAYKKTREA